MKKKRGSPKGVSKQAPTEEEYNLEVEKFRSISKEIGRPLKYEELSEYGLRDSRWYILHSSNEKVKDFNNFIEYEIGMIPRYGLSKEGAIKCVLELQDKLKRPIMKKDLVGVKNGSIGQGVIQRYWGGFNNMKKELGLEIVGQNLREKERSIFIIKRDIVKLCAYILEKENRYTITLSDWKKLDGITSWQSCEKWFRDNGSSLREFINNIGFELVKAGNGLNYYFENDSEKVTSQYELDFSKKLRSIGLQYNKDYIKNVRYSTFINNYKGHLDCDYVIDYKGIVIYVEIAGMLRDYKDWYLNNKPITSSKSKERYRLTLSKKEQLFKEADLKYYILFPCDLNEEYLSSLLGEFA